MKKTSMYFRSVVLFVVMFSFFATQMCYGEKSYYVIKVTATAYCPCSICCGRHSPGITKTGRNAQLEGVAVDPNIIPLGSRVDVPIYNRGPNNNGSWILCDDTGGRIKGYRIDVRFTTHSEAVEWGVKKLSIKVYEP